ncbi:MAG: hypothetical protein FWD66_05935 [Paludibacter sp.]|nr:hypothetical protein [Paludibacter sp.]
MKKFLTTGLLIATVLISCKKDDNNTPTATNLTFEGYYYGDYYNNGTENFDFAIYTKGLFDSYGNWTGNNGEYFYVDLNSASILDGAPKAGTYTFSSESGHDRAAGTFFDAVYRYVKDGVSSADINTTGGTVEISSSKIVVKFTNADGHHSITYVGESPLSWLCMFN